MNALVLVGDAFGGRGGIAQYNRHLLRALCEYPDMQRVIAIPATSPASNPANSAFDLLIGARDYEL